MPTRTSCQSPAPTCLSPATPRSSPTLCPCSSFLSPGPDTHLPSLTPFSLWPTLSIQTPSSLMSPSLIPLLKFMVHFQQALTGQESVRRMDLGSLRTETLPASPLLAQCLGPGPLPHSAAFQQTGALSVPRVTSLSPSALSLAQLQSTLTKPSSPLPPQQSSLVTLPDHNVYSFTLLKTPRAVNP